MSGQVDSQRGAFIKCDAWDTRATEALAVCISSATGATCFSFLAQTSADCYALGEYECGSLVREISFSRDDQGSLPPAGTERAWEAEFHFALPLNEFLDRLGDDDWSDQDLDAARVAHQSRRLDKLPRLPQPTGSSVLAFLTHLGVDLEHPLAMYRNQVLLAMRR